MLKYKLKKAVNTYEKIVAFWSFQQSANFPCSLCKRSVKFSVGNFSVCSWQQNTCTLHHVQQINERFTFAFGTICWNYETFMSMFEKYLYRTDNESASKHWKFVLFYIDLLTWIGKRKEKTTQTRSSIVQIKAFLWFGRIQKKNKLKSQSNL